MARMFNLTIAVFNVRLANLGFMTGYSMKRWQTRLNVMLEKEAGNLNVNKLWIILLFESNAKYPKLLAPEQWELQRKICGDPLSQ